jgi:hypothetical protein
MKARVKFVELEKNKQDKYAIGWRWATNVIDFREYSAFDLSTAITYIGIPDDEEKKWKNGWYSCEYNESLNWLLEVGLVEILYDEVEEETQ